MGHDITSVRQLEHQAKLDLYFKTISDLYRMLFPDSQAKEECEVDREWAGAVRSLIERDGFSGGGNYEILDDINAEIARRRIQSAATREADRPVIQFYCRHSTGPTAPMYECVPEEAAFNITSHEKETEDSKPGARSYVMNGYTWMMVAFGSGPLTRVSETGAYESARDVADWLERETLTRKLAEAFSGA